MHIYLSRIITSVFRNLFFRLRFFETKEPGISIISEADNPSSFLPAPTVFFLKHIYSCIQCLLSLLFPFFLPVPCRVLKETTNIFTFPNFSSKKCLHRIHPPLGIPKTLLQQQGLVLRFRQHGDMDDVRVTPGDSMLVRPLLEDPSDEDGALHV